METLSVGMLIDTVYPYTHGGAEKRYAVFARELAARGHEVTMYAMRWWPGPRCRSEGGVRYVGVAAPQRLYANGDRRGLLQPAIYGLSALRTLGRSRHDVADGNQFPLVHLPAAALAAARNGHPLVVTWHEVWQRYWFRYAPFPAGMVGAALERAAPHLADHNVAVGHLTAGRLEGLGLRAGRVSVVPNPVDLAKVEAAEPSPEGTDLVFAGRLLAHKRIDRLLAAVAHLPGHASTARLTVVGSGPDEPRLRALARALGLDGRVRFTGAVQDEAALLGLLKSARLFVTASEREGFCTAALEAMACGLPVCTVAGPDNALPRELMADGDNGIVVREPRARAIAAALGEALADDRRLRSMGAKARLTAQAYDGRRLTRDLERVYRTAARGAPRPRPHEQVVGVDAPASVR